MQSALLLQQTLADAQPLHLARGGAAADAFRLLASSLGITVVGDDAAAAFSAVLDRLLDAGLASWIVDYVAVVCCDAGASSDDPSGAHLLREDAVAAWCARATAGLQERLDALLQGGGGAGGAEEAAGLAAVGAAADALLRVASALRVARAVR